MSHREEGGTGFLKGLFLGALAGAGIFYFLDHTEEGEKIKKKIKKQGKEALKDLRETIDELEEKGEKFKSQAKELQLKLEKKDLFQIEKLRERGRKAVKRFTRKGKPLKKTP